MTIIKKFQETKQLLDQAEEGFKSIELEIENQRNVYRERIKSLSEQLQFTQFEETDFKKFLTEPYAILPTGKSEEWFIVVPKFIRMNLGWLDHSTQTFNIFRINKFANWLGDIPNDIQRRFKFGHKIPAKVFDGMVLTGEDHQDEVWDKYSHYLTRREGKDKIKIKQGMEFKFIAKLIDDGILPFMPRPLEKEDLRTPEISFDMRDYQKEAWQKFSDTGATGIYWAFSAGKTFFGMYACASIKGPKLVIVPTVTLVEQWEQRLKQYTNIANEVQVMTYRSFEKVRNKEWALTIYDECHHLPANMFSKLGTLNTKYRIGLSATPYREDGRTDYIFALTGFPIGLSWDNLIELGIIEEPDIRLYIFNDWRQKEEKLKELLTIQKKTIVFCDSISLGQRLSKRFEIPFVYGSTSNRIEIINEADVSIVSRVGDEGLSIPDIERVIEIDFLFGSRRQEGQRMGRLFHGEGKGEHLILMTEKEYEEHSKRLYSITEKGFRIEVIR